MLTLLGAVTLAGAADTVDVASIVGASERGCRVSGIADGQHVVLFSPDSQRVPHEQLVVVRNQTVTWISDGASPEFLISEGYSWTLVPEVSGETCYVVLQKGEVVRGMLVGPRGRPLLFACVHVCGQPVFADATGRFEVWVPTASTCEVTAFGIDSSRGVLAETIQGSPTTRDIGVVVMKHVAPAGGPDVRDDMPSWYDEQIAWLRLGEASHSAEDPATDAVVETALANWTPATFSHGGHILSR